MHRISIAAVTVAVVFSSLSPLRADIRLPAIIADNMVLQQGRPAPIWGWADPGEEVRVVFAGQSKDAKADADGRWRVTLDPVRASAENRTLGVRSMTGNSVREVRNVLVGEVWICSGQSNMQWSVSNAVNAEQEIAQADYPTMRLFRVPNVTAALPQDDCEGQWQVCSPETVPGFSAVGYFFGRHLHRQLGVPVGLINTSWGGTVAEAWTSAPALRERLPKFNEGLDRLVGQDESVAQARARHKAQMAAYNAAVQKMYAMEDDLDAADRWAAVELDDSQWKTMTVPANWETTPDFKDVDGIVWFRKTLDVPPEWAGKDLVLKPGPIDEVEVTWFNGTRVGARGNIRRKDVRFWNVPREYPIPGKLVRKGKNVVAIRVIDAAAQGGLWGADASTMVVELVDGEDALANELEDNLPTTLSLAGEWRCFGELILPPRPVDSNNPNRPSVLYNAMIHPLIPFAIQGAIWYQGESNASRAEQYRTLLPTMIGNWRALWGQGDFTFLIVQLANFMKRAEQPEDTAWAALREAQTMTAASDPNTGLALAIDIGEANDIHPRNKQDVGKRLGLAARALAYGQDIPYSGPVYRSMVVDGSRAVLSFDHANGGLIAKGGELTGFAVAGADGKFAWAKAEIRGEQVVVQADDVAQPAAVRYAWANNPDCNLYNGAGLPAVPFRTDAP